MGEGWLRGDLIALGEVEDRELLTEVRRVLAVLEADAAWTAWWGAAERDRVLEVLLLVTRAPSSPFAEGALRYAGADEGVRRRRGTVEVRHHVDRDVIAALPPGERRAAALPAVLGALRRVREAYGHPEHPPVPAQAHPAPLDEATQRRRRLRALLADRERGASGS